MDENKTPLIGTPVSVTLFIVDYQYTKSPRKDKLPKSSKKEDDVVKNTAVISTGDPTGQDVYGIAKRVVLGAVPYDGNDFRVLRVQRAFDAIGLAQVTSWEKIDGQAPEEAGVAVGDDEEDSGDGSEGSDQSLN
jgi:hypothetical protein